MSVWWWHSPGWRAETDMWEKANQASHTFSHLMLNKIYSMCVKPCLLFSTFAALWLAHPHTHTHTQFPVHVCLSSFIHSAMGKKISTGITVRGNRMSETMFLFTPTMNWQTALKNANGEDCCNIITITIAKTFQWRVIIRSITMWTSRCRILIFLGFWEY